MNSRERVLAMLEGRAVDSLPAMPITMMFAADQIGAKYFHYATDYRVLAEGQICVAERFDIDYVSVISDPACEPSALGATIKFFPDQPPAIEEENALLKNKAGLASLKVPDPAQPGRMRNRAEGVRLMKERVGNDKVVEGWIEGPCAEAADLRGINTLMLDFYDDPAFIRDLFEFVVAMELRFARFQVELGADLIGVGDAAASLVGPKFYDEFVWPYERKLVDALHGEGIKTRLHICGNTRRILEGMGRLHCSMVDLDSLSPVSEGREKMGPEQVILGNLDPVRVLKDGTPESVYEAVGECHRQAGERFIVGAGCEVPRETPPANLRAMVQYAREHSALAS
ncbi:MAG: uroporphyrinogen decarboxylase family protein [Terriglobia bacterium]